METTAAAEFDAFVGARERALLGFALLLTADRHAAEDLLQVALTKLFLSWPRVRPADAEAWVRRVMVNANISVWRRTGRREVTTEQVPETPGDDQPAVVDQRDQLRRALAQLGRRQRTAVVLRHYAGLSETETAAAMGCSVGTVKSQTSRGLSTLRQLLGDDQRIEVLP